MSQPSDVDKMVVSLVDATLEPGTSGEIRADAAKSPHTRRLAVHVLGLIDAAVEAEREACARLLSALFASSKFRDPREVQTAVTEGQKLIRARGGDRE